MQINIQPVVLVNEKDEVIGTMEKMEAHRTGVLHRAFSVFLFNAKGEMLLQQRAPEKYHSGGLWTNACCSHPFPEENPVDAGKRRLQDELGFSTEIQPAFQFVYKAYFENGLTEYEYDHVLIGEYNGEIHPNPLEVSDIKYLSLQEIESELLTRPKEYTAWFHLAFPKVKQWKNQSEICIG